THAAEHVARAVTTWIEREIPLAEQPRERCEQADGAPLLVTTFGNAAIAGQARDLVQPAILADRTTRSDGGRVHIVPGGETIGCNLKVQRAADPTTTEKIDRAADFLDRLRLERSYPLVVA